MITKEMMAQAIQNYTRMDYDYHFELFQDESDFVKIARKTFAKEIIGDILAYMPTSLLKIDKIPRGYIVTEKFIYSENNKPIFIDAIKDVSIDQGLLVIDYLGGGKREYLGGAFIDEVYQLLLCLKQVSIDFKQFSCKEILQLAIATYIDDGGYAFELADQKAQTEIQNIYHLKDEVVGYLDSSLLKNYKQGFVITEDCIYSEYFTSHDQEPINLNLIEHCDVARNRLRIYNIDGSKRAVYVSVYGNDLCNLIHLYLNLLKEKE